MFGQEGKKLDLYPEPLRPQIDATRVSPAFGAQGFQGFRTVFVDMRKSGPSFQRFASKLKIRYETRLVDKHPTKA